MSTPPPRTNWQLLTISKYKPNTEEFTDEYAGLSDDEKSRWERLYNYNQNRANALTINGTRYSNEDEYNSTVNKTNTSRNTFIKDSFDKAWKEPTSRWLKDRRDNTIQTMQGIAPRGGQDGVVSSKEAREHYRNLKRGYRKIYAYNRANPKAPISIPTFRAATKPLEEYKGSAALTKEELESNTFTKKNGGQLKYYKPKK